MKKETLIAIFFGILFGGVLAFLLLSKNNQLRLTKTKTIAPTGKENVKPKNVEELKNLKILEPLDRSVYESGTVSIKGEVDKDGLILIQSPIKETIFKNKEEKFTMLFPLALGENVIKITAYSKDGQTRVQEKELHIYYLDEQL